MVVQSTPNGPFIAWTDSDDWPSGPSLLRRSCETHLRLEMEKLRPIVGDPAIEGIIVYDRLDRGLAVASLLGSQGRTLPFTADGASCDTLFDETELFQATRDHRLMGAVHEGSQGMLLRLAADESRRVLLMPRYEAARFSPLGRKDGVALGPASVGLLAHELGHARDYADGRLGRPSPHEIAKVCKPERVDALHTIVDMALAEYVATRAECAAQVSAFGGCSEELVARIRPMAQSQPSPVRWAEKPDDPTEAAQLVMDRTHLGYSLGTLAAYAHAKASVLDRAGSPWGQTTEDLVARGTPRGVPMRGLLKDVAPALERAATQPSDASRCALARATEMSIVALEAKSTKRALPLAQQR